MTGRSTMHVISAFQWIQDCASNCGQVVHLAFVDITKVCDAVSHEGLFGLLKNLGVGKKEPPSHTEHL